MKVIKEFQGVVDGEVYPRTFVPGDVCPPELQEAGVALGVVEAAEPGDAPKAPATREKKVKQ